MNKNAKKMLKRMAVEASDIGGYTNPETYRFWRKVWAALIPCLACAFLASAWLTHKSWPSNGVSFQHEEFGIFLVTLLANVLCLETLFILLVLQSDRTTFQECQKWERARVDILHFGEEALAQANRHPNFWDAYETWRQKVKSMPDKQRRRLVAIDLYFNFLTRPRREFYARVIRRCVPMISPAKPSG